MANTYTQIYIHTVFAVAARACVIRPEHKEELHRYIAGIVTHRNQKLIAINCMPDHTHILVGLKPDCSVSELVGKIKTGSTNHINTQRLIGCRFSWQEGFGAFSVSQSHLTAVYRYIQNQEEHHRRKTFHEEYLRLLNRHDIPFDKRYVFKTIE